MFLSLYFLIVPVTARFLQTAYIDKDKIVHYTKEAVMRTVRLYHPVLKQNQDCFFVAFLRLKTGSAFMQGLFLRGDAMYYITSEASFDGAHFLRNYSGKCRNLHGHHWLVRVHMRSYALQRDIQTDGMLNDFGDLKKILKDLCDYFDHSLIYEAGSLRKSTLACLAAEEFLLREVPFRPTAENLAKYFYDTLQAKRSEIYRVEVYETPANCAAYEAQ